ncbi:chitobiase/beta-hexosaminidase C-terminal domain-containing protein [Paenibacillus humicola]|uniref:chitobiase/beta-hexosaminidase C-terminal domain-containing protein n=1 Tax=Paenibacillus humicola TaxID=3110540 RepID=UPI00237B0E93|nr:chitobiase/beta-hexosaminidase C-terminal domain-containing protein [Paenibacillus humicola]
MKKRFTLLLVFILLLSLMPTLAIGDAKPPSYEIEIDDLQDWSQVYQHSGTLLLQTVPKAPDPTRVIRGGDAGEYIVYRAKGNLRSFSVYGSIASTVNPVSHPSFAISSDGKNYRTIVPDIHEDTGDSVAIDYESRNFPATTKFLKISFAGTGTASSPSIGKVVLNGPSSVEASVPSGTVPFGSMILLNRGSQGDTVYYTTDGSDPRFSLTRKFYSSPIPVTGKLLLKTTAVNHSGTGRSAASRVSTYQYTTDTTAVPPDGLDDPLNNFKQLLSRANVYEVGSTPGYFGNDAGRITRTSTGPGILVYHSDTDMHAVTVYGSYFTGLPIEDVRISASADGNTYTDAKAESYTAGYPSSNWQPYAFEVSALPEHTQYLKVELIGSAKSWSPQITRVVINRNTASVHLQAFAADQGKQVFLSSATEGARIYYRLNKGTDFLPYNGPIPLQGYNTLEAYAVKDGMVPSPIRKYAVNASSDIEVDRYGQMTNASWTGKVKSDEDLAKVAQDNADYFGGLTAPSDRDPYGGLAGSAQKYGLKATGYFDVQQMGSRKVMTTPNGDLYFSLAVNGVTPNETYTQVAGREEKFEQLPPYEGEYNFAYLGQDNFSFYMANKYDETGEIPTEHSVYMEAIDRLREWGFNGVGNYSPEKYGEEGKLPYVRMLPLSGMSWAKLDGISIFDIFAPNAEAKIDEAFSKTLPEHKDDKMLIGYFIDNEYDFQKFYSNVLNLKASSAAIKGKLVQVLQTKYGSVDAFNAAWKTDFRSFDEMKEAPIPLKTSEAWADMDDFYKLYLDTFFGTVSKLYRKYDPNHLLLGDRWITTVFHNKKLMEPLAEIEGKYVDVISINYYTYSFEPDLLQDVYEKSGGRPILFSEFGYGTSEEGLNPLLVNSATNQFQRGMRYRNYVEEAASLPYVVGAHVFNYVDQAGLGRYWQGVWGEHYNSGLVNVADIPYKSYLQGVMDTNDDIYKIMLGERPKFYYNFSSK